VVSFKLSISAPVMALQIASAAAAEIAVYPPHSIISVIGDLVEGDAQAFEEKTAPLSSNFIVRFRVREALWRKRSESARAFEKKDSPHT
jgi:hypothetical protein